MKERILCAAIKFDDGKVYPHHKKYGTGLLACGFRHHNCLMLRPHEFRGTQVQGFLTSHDRFVDRREAKIIAMNANQINSVATDSINLYSEDIY